jgi:two-component system chemotaxis response regulator CheY
MGRSILIVDDSATTRAFIRRAVRMAGVDADAVHEAADGAIGLDLLRAHRVDLVFADLQMPNLDGEQMVRQMWADPALRRTPVVMVSADPDTDRLEALRAAGAAGVLRKPFTPEEFSAAVAPLFGGAL